MPTRRRWSDQKSRGREPTAEELAEETADLEQIIEEQYECLPAWWWDDFSRGFYETEI